MPFPGRGAAARGAFTFVLHSHIPYCRLAGRWPHGEEWLHEAASETYIRLLMALDDLANEGVDFRLTIGVTPVLMEQLADDTIKEHLAHFLNDKLTRAEADLARAGGPDDEARRAVAAFYVDFYGSVLDAFEHRYRRDLLGALRRLQDRGLVEVITSAATHGYLPLLARDSSIVAQLRAGVTTYERHLGRRPRAIWLPECGYRPAQVDASGHVRAGLEAFLAAEGLRCFFSETHLVEGGRPVGKAVGDVMGPYGEVMRRHVVPESEVAPVGGTTYEAYWVHEPRVAVLARNNRTGLQVWSAEHGYPGDPVYREFHKKDGVSGLQYWRITGPGVELHEKDWYDPEIAKRRAREHARHYAGLVRQLLTDYQARTSRFGIVAAAYDTELFGHWWFEGIVWLKDVLRELSADPAVELTTASEYLEAHPPERVLALPAGSWGDGGGDFTWLNPDTAWMWPRIHEVEARMEALAARWQRASRAERRVIAQAGREALLVESSDWPFLVTTGQAREYAEQRFREHLARFHELADAVESGRAADPEVQQLADDLWEADRVFPQLDGRWFGREASALAP